MTQAITQHKKEIKGWLKSDDFKAALAQSLPKHMTTERFVRVSLTATMKNPKLLECTRESIFKCMLDLSSLGLEPDGRRAHLIPYGKEAQLIIDYKGLIELAKRSGEIKSWRAMLVCENDIFKEINGQVQHEVDWLNPKGRGKAVAVYSHVVNQYDIHDYEIMTFDEVEAVRKRSKAGKSGPWVSDFNEMAKKTVMRRHSKRLTLSPEFNDALDKDYDVVAQKEEFKPLGLVDIMPSSTTIDDSNVESTVVHVENNKEVEFETVDMSTGEVVESDPLASNASKKAVIDALEKSAFATKEILNDYIDKMHNCKSINDLKESQVKDVVRFIIDYQPANPASKK